MAVWRAKLAYLIAFGGEASRAGNHRAGNHRFYTAGDRASDKFSGASDACQQQQLHMFGANGFVVGQVFDNTATARDFDGGRLAIDYDGKSHMP